MPSLEIGGQNQSSKLIQLVSIVYFLVVLTQMKIWGWLASQLKAILCHFSSPVNFYREKVTAQIGQNTLKNHILVKITPTKLIKS